MSPGEGLKPVVVVVYKSAADGVRELAGQLGLSYEEEAVLGHANAIRLRFAPLDGAMRSRLALAIPREALVKRAVFD